MARGGRSAVLWALLLAASAGCMRSESSPLTQQVSKQVARDEARGESTQDKVAKDTEWQSAAPAAEPAAPQYVQERKVRPGQPTKGDALREVMAHESVGNAADVLAQSASSRARGRAGGAAKPKKSATSVDDMWGVVVAAPVPAQPSTIAAPPAANVAEHNTESYKNITDNSFELVRDQPLSTFSVDVDTASYSNVRRFLREGQLPPVDAVRIEELVNYFDYDYPAPRGNDAFAAYTELGPCPWNSEHRLVHIGIAGKQIAQENVPARNLVFLLDVSGSMEDPNKLPLLKHGLTMLTQTLRSQDRVSIVVYAGSSGLVLPSTPGSNHAAILDALTRLQAGGSTNGGEGIQLAYQEAVRNYVPGGINRVILATDGDFNVGVTSEGALNRLIEEKRKSGVFLTVLGFGSGNLRDSQMEQLADKGNGNYAYIDDVDEAHKVLVREAGATLVTIAKDVKLQVEFNPKQVESYRLVGYENRVLAARDFNDDKKDAGEIGAGHTVTALYEIVPRTQGKSAREVDPLRYQGERADVATNERELLTVKIRYKAPTEDVSKLIAAPFVPPAQSSGMDTWESHSDAFRFSAAVAEFGLLLRQSPHKGNASLQQIKQLAQRSLAQDPHGDRAQFMDMLSAAGRLGLGS